jgi:hypothetical protein
MNRNLEESIMTDDFPPEENRGSRPKGFDYHVSQEQIDEYRTWPYERRLNWLQAGNRLRQALPRRIIEIQDKFRRGEI